MIQKNPKIRIKFGIQIVKNRKNVKEKNTEI